VPEGAPKSPFGAILGTFGVPVAASGLFVAHPRAPKKIFRWHLLSEYLFVGPGAPREFAGGRGAAPRGDMGKHHFGLAGVGYT